MKKTKEILTYKFQQPQSWPYIQVKTVTKDDKSYKLILNKITSQQHSSEKQSNDRQKLIKRCKKYMQIKHENVELIIDVFQHFEDDHHFIGIVGQTDRQNLLDLFGSRQSNKCKILKSILLDIVKGLASLHQKQLIYQNFNLFNVQKKHQSEKYQLKFSHFRQINSFNKCCHRTGYYTPPEIYYQQGFTNKADIWSLAILFIQIFNKRSLHSLTNFDNNPCCDPNFPSRTLLQKVPNSTFRGLIRQMLKKEPVQRPSVVQILNYIQNIDIQNEDDDDEEQIQERAALTYFKIPIFDINVRKKNLNMFQKISKRYKKQNTLLAKEINVNNFRIQIKLDKMSQSLIINGQFKSSVNLHFEKQYNIQKLFQVCPGLSRCYQKIQEFYQQISHVPSKNYDVIETGELKIGILSQTLIKNIKKLSQSSLELNQQPFIYTEMNTLSQNIQHKKLRSQGEGVNGLSQMSKASEVMAIYYGCMFESSPEYQQIINEVLALNMYGVDHHQTLNHKKAIEYFLNAISLSDSIPEKQFERYFLYFNIGLCYFSCQLYEECNQYCLKYEENLFLRNRQTPRAIQHRSSICLIVFMCGMISAHIISKQEQSNWEEKFDLRLGKTVANQLKIKSFNKIISYYRRNNNFQKQEKYIYIIISLIDAQVQTFDKQLIRAHIDTAIILINSDPMYLKQTLRIFSKVVNIIRLNKQVEKDIYQVLISNLFTIKSNIQMSQQYHFRSLMNQWLQKYLKDFDNII